MCLGNQHGPSTSGPLILPLDFNLIYFFEKLIEYVIFYFWQSENIDRLLKNYNKKFIIKSWKNYNNSQLLFIIVLLDIKSNKIDTFLFNTDSILSVLIIKYL